jgi:hypothetical protein
MSAFGGLALEVFEQAFEGGGDLGIAARRGAINAGRGAGFQGRIHVWILP